VVDVDGRGVGGRASADDLDTPVVPVRDTTECLLVGASKLENNNTSHRTWTVAKEKITDSAIRWVKRKFHGTVFLVASS